VGKLVYFGDKQFYHVCIWNPPMANKAWAKCFARLKLTADWNGNEAFRSEVHFAIVALCAASLRFYVP